ncbi:hypothetical protein [Mucilaginibacter sp. L196]|uniref:hypothetical protein n=1 Tax=Mucilaginibacter sp. L196 TaxID=1641870 RepID=UPI00131C8890|nr:hypothetical protein [Mucilaginibacter sp. L196]
MNYELELLETLADWLKKQVVFNEQDVLIHEETKRLRKAMLKHIMTLTNDTQINTYLQIHLYKLVEICDLLYHPENENNFNSAATLELLIAIRQAANSFAPQDLKLPLLLRQIKCVDYAVQWININKALKDQIVDEVLIDIIAYPIENFANIKSQPKWSNDNYLSLFIGALEDIPQNVNVDVIIHLLIRIGYNFSRFTAYCYRWMQQKLEGKDQEEKLKLLWVLKKEIRQHGLLNNLSFDDRRLPITEELCNWIDEEQTSLIHQQSENPSNQMKINTKLKVLQLAYWEKLQYDNGVYDEANLDILSEKIAFNFSSKFQEELSAPSIKSKFYPKDRSIIEPIEKLLVKMLEEVRQFLH